LPALAASVTIAGMALTTSDDELVEQTLRGDRAAFQELTVRYYRPVGAFILKRVERPDLIEDLLQETFLEAYQALKAGRLPGRFSSWLFGIARNRCGKWLRRKRPVLFAPDQAEELTAAVSEPALREEVEEQESRLAHLQAHLAKLPDETRQMLDWKHRDGKTCAQIAAATGKPVGTVKSVLARTYKSLREALAPR
jgi:RNA polymerase sigma-70 factor (ECF subfamily)